MRAVGDDDIFITWTSELEGGDAVVVYLCGELDASSSPTFLADIQKLANDARNVIMDVRLLSYIDSTGVSALLSISSAIEGAGKWMCLVGCHGVLARILEVARIQDRLRCFEDIDQAVEQMSAGAGQTRS